VGKKAAARLKAENPLSAGKTVLSKYRCTLKSKNPLIAAKSRPWSFVKNREPVLRKSMKNRSSLWNEQLLLDER